ncbi:PLP-dependent aminotransferase family protein [Bradyrhizobium yuanmingense]|uniref:aminotransferase-like domain-containing protein n=1 Tax=Bradyrhizobium yuanmingense TaxID=108015 RepID=UPI0023B8CB6D|nr:PLP-dependent aminotransferase family protein [Bradyrhizobium yuanmingense]MDF0522700.1 PLP-dependent aminotransferase family protein [Bradyrhizobium yuanmingense]
MRSSASLFRKPASSPIYFTRGVPPSEAIPSEELGVIARSLVDRPTQQLFQYAPSDGYLGDRVLRTAIGEANRVSPDEVFIGNGSLQVLDLLAAILVKPERSTVLVEQPTYDRSIRIFGRHGARVVGVPLQGDGIDTAMLAEQMKRLRAAALYLIPDFQNPAGITTSLAKRRQILDLAAEFDVLVIEDTPYRELRFEGVAQPLFKDIAGRARVVTIGSLSKTLSPGLRIGYAIGSGALMRQLAELATDTYLSPAPICQSIAAECFRAGLVERNIVRVRDLIRPKWAAAIGGASEIFGRDCMCLPQGGYFLGITVNSDLSEPAFIASASTAGVIMTPGSAFFPSEGQPGSGTLFLRLPFHALDPGDFRSGIEILQTILVNGRQRSRAADLEASNGQFTG